MIYYFPQNHAKKFEQLERIQINLINFFNKFLFQRGFSHFHSAGGRSRNVDYVDNFNNKLQFYGTLFFSNIPYHKTVSLSTVKAYNAIR